MRRSVHARPAAIVLVAAVVSSVAGFSPAAERVDESGRVTWSANSGDVRLTAAARQRADGRRCLAARLIQPDAAAAALSTCLTRLREQPHGVVVLQCATRLAVVAGLARGDVRSVRVRTRDDDAPADSVQTDVLDGATFFAHGLAFDALPTHVALRDAAGAVVARMLITRPPTGCGGRGDAGNSVYRSY